MRPVLSSILLAMLWWEVLGDRKIVVMVDVEVDQEYCSEIVRNIKVIL